MRNSWTTRPTTCPFIRPPAACSSRSTWPTTCTPATATGSQVCFGGALLAAGRGGAGEAPRVKSAKEKTSPAAVINESFEQKGDTFFYR